MKIKNELVKTVLVLGLMVGLFAAGVLVPYGIRDAALHERMSQAKSDLGIDRTGNKGLVRLYDEVERRRAELDESGRFIPDKDGIAGVMMDFSGLVNTAGVTGQEIVTNQAKYYADYNILPVQIQFNAPFGTAFDLINHIEQLSSVVRVDQMEIEASPKYPHEPLTVNLTLSAFFAKESIGGGS